jgi:exonuclease VII small subunit
MHRRLSWQEQQELPAGLEEVFTAFTRGEAQAREAQTKT